MNEISLQYGKSTIADDRNKNGTQNNRKNNEHKFLFKYNQNFLSINSNLVHTLSFRQQYGKKRKKKMG